MVFLVAEMADQLRAVLLVGNHGIALNTEQAESYTGTDTDAVQIGRAGIPCVLIDLPLKYMHTTVELLDTNALRECGRLVAHFTAEIDEGWDDELWI